MSFTPVDERSLVDPPAMPIALGEEHAYFAKFEHVLWRSP
jgi:hypothetical protein